MRKIMCLLLFWTNVVHATTFYVATPVMGGNNNNSGTSTLTPFATWQKLATVMVAGDLAYIRGGTYQSPFNINPETQFTHCDWNRLNGSPGNLISIFNYPGEYPVLNLSAVNVPNGYSDPSGVFLRNSDHVHIKGLRITGLISHRGVSGISIGFKTENIQNCIIEQVEVDHIEGLGFKVENSTTDCTFKNCDAHHLADPFSTDPWGGADGFSITHQSNTSNHVVFDGCRAWWCSDDGFDLFAFDGITTFKNCWAFWNGFQPGTFIAAGDGEGFKLGPDKSYVLGGASAIREIVTRTLIGCLAFENRDCGFNQNVADTRFILYNNTAYANGGVANFKWDHVVPAPVCTSKNNLSYIHASNAYQGLEIKGNNNSWSGGVNVTADDFVSVSSLGMDGPREAEGALPQTAFLRLAANTDLVDAGTDVSIPFYGSFPDIGAFENTPGVDLKLFLQGYYRGAGSMEPAMKNQQMGGSSTKTDTITVALHNSTAPFGLVTFKKIILNTNGTALAQFPSSISGAYYIVIKHRNSVQTWTAAPVILGYKGAAKYDFTQAASRAYGSNQILIDAGTWGIYVGDVNQDEMVNEIDFELFNQDNFNAVHGIYISTDLNGDGFVDGNDYSMYDLNNFMEVRSIHP